MVTKGPSFFFFSTEDEISGTAILKPNLALAIRKWNNLWTIEETSGRVRYNVNFARVRDDILVLHDHKFTRRYEPHRRSLIQLQSRQQLEFEDV